MSKLYVVLGIKPPKCGYILPDVFSGVTLRQPEGPYEEVHFICETKERVKDIRNSYIKIKNVYEIDAKLINIDKI